MSNIVDRYFKTEIITPSVLVKTQRGELQIDKGTTKSSKKDYKIKGTVNKANCHSLKNK